MNDNRKKKKTESFGKTVPPEPYDSDENEIPTDVLGSYTGVPLDRNHPEQDVDDL